jgi:hypothetical protein
MWRKGNKRFGGGGDPPAKRQAAGKDGPSGDTGDGTVVAQVLVPYPRPTYRSLISPPRSQMADP